MERATTATRYQRAGIVTAALGLVLALAACDDAPTGGGAGGAPPVTVSQPIEREVTEWDEYTGRFAAVEYVEVRARVSGYVDGIHFKDGQVVIKNDLLFVIDPRPFRIAVEQAEAELAQAQSRLELAAREVERARPLVKRKNLSEQAFDERMQARREAEASVQAGRAAVDAAKLNLEFTEVKAPVTGRVSRHLVSVGNLVNGGTANSTLLTNIVSLDPIHFYFDVDENAFLKYVRLSRSGERPSSRDSANPVHLSLTDEDEFIHTGRMDFVDNQVDVSTGTMRGRAVFDNPDLVFTPGLFGRIRLLGRGNYAALMLPDEVIGTDQSRRFVYVVGGDDTVEYRQVRLGPIIDGLRVVHDGISAEDWVIVNGIQRARTGGKVTPERKPLAEQAAAPAQ